MVSKAGNFEDYKLEFKARYDTPYPGFAEGGTPDWKHYPNWTTFIKKTGADSRDGISLEDSYVWNGYYFHKNTENLVQTGAPGTKNVWHDFKIVSNQGNVKIYIDDMDVPLFDRNITDIKNGKIGFMAQDEKLWIDNFKATASQIPTSVSVTGAAKLSIPVISEKTLKYLRVKSSYQNLHM